MNIETQNKRAAMIITSRMSAIAQKMRFQTARLFIKTRLGYSPSRATLTDGIRSQIMKPAVEVKIINNQPFVKEIMR